MSKIWEPKNRFASRMIHQQQLGLGKQLFRLIFLLNIGMIYVILQFNLTMISIFFKTGRFFIRGVRRRVYKILHFIAANEELESRKTIFDVPIPTKDTVTITEFLFKVGMNAYKSISHEETLTLVREIGAILLNRAKELHVWWENKHTAQQHTIHTSNCNEMVNSSAGKTGHSQSVTPHSIGRELNFGASIGMSASLNGIFGRKNLQLIASNYAQLRIPYSEELSLFFGKAFVLKLTENLKQILQILAGGSASAVQFHKSVDLYQLRIFYQEIDEGCLADPDLRNAMESAVRHLNSVLKPSVVEPVQLKKLRKISKKDASGLEFIRRLEKLNPPVNPYLELIKWVLGLTQQTFLELIIALLDKNKVIHESLKHDYVMKKRNELRAEMQKTLGFNGVFIYPKYSNVNKCQKERLRLSCYFTAAINALEFPTTTVSLGKGSNGLLMDLQVLANFNQEYLCLTVAKELERGLGGKLIQI